MKLRRATIENFRGLKTLEIDFLEDSSEGGQVPRSLTCLVGDNGAGKTSALQAIGLILWMAGARERRVDVFGWEGFLPERIGTLGKTRVEVEVAFTEQEIDSPQKSVFSFVSVDNTTWLQPFLGLAGAPDLSLVTLVLEDGAVTPPPHRLPRVRRSSVDGAWSSLPSRNRIWLQGEASLAPSSGFSRIASLVRMSVGSRRLVGHAHEPRGPGPQRDRPGFTVQREPQSRLPRSPDSWGWTRTPPPLRALARSASIASSSAAGSPTTSRSSPSGEQAVFPFAYEFALRAPGPSVVLIDQLAPPPPP